VAEWLDAIFDTNEWNQSLDPHLICVH